MLTWGKLVSVCVCVCVGVCVKVGKYIRTLYTLYFSATLKLLQIAS